MGRILSRYIFRETALTWLAVTGVLLAVLLTDQFAKVLDDAAGAQLPKNAIFLVLGLSSIHFLTILIPVGIFLAIMLAFARLYRDSEMTAIMACGVGGLARAGRAGGAPAQARPSQSRLAAPARRGALVVGAARAGVDAVWLARRGAARAAGAR